MSTQSRVAPHSGNGVSHQAEGPKATLRQVAELLGLIEQGRVERQYMQDFLRFRLGRLPAGAQVSLVSEGEGELLLAIEARARKHFPGHVNEILDLLRPWCDPKLNMEFVRPQKNSHVQYDRSGVTKALAEEALRGWYPYSVKVQVMELGRKYAADLEAIEKVRTMTHLDCLVRDYMSPRVVEVVLAGNHNIATGVNAIGLSDDVWRSVCGAISRTGASRHRVLWGFESERIEGSITVALRCALVFIVTGDDAKLSVTKRFLDFQRSGTPLVAVEDGHAVVLCAPVE